MLDPLDSLVFSLYTSKGVYALLLGSGLSRSAGIPTGWEVTQDLIRRLAASRGEATDPDPETWFRRAFGTAPDYPGLLRGLALSRAERQQLLRGYFEPTEEDRQQGRKVPQPAHRAIARLVRAGYIRVVITTNFDRLIELALADEGVTPVVASSPAQAAGAAPLSQVSCLLVKAHGDYLEAEAMKNTEEELASYHRSMRALLSRIFDEFGLVVCGWSGDSDHALTALLAASRNRRYAAYWAHRGQLADRAQRLSEHRHAVLTVIKDADSFFTTLAERIESLAEFDRPHPFSKAIAVETLKRYLVDDRQRIRLGELLSEEMEKVASQIGDERRFSPSEQPSAEAYRVRLDAYANEGETLEALLAAGCYWGGAQHDRMWSRTVERLARAGAAEQAGYTPWAKLRRYPALRMLFVGSLAALAAEKPATVRALLTDPLLRINDQPRYLTEVVNQLMVLDPDLLNAALTKRYHVPGSELLFSALRNVLRPYVSDDARYQELFDQFEYLLAADLADATGEDWVPLGRFGYKLGGLGGGGRDIESLRSSVRAQGREHLLLRSGFFGGDPERFEKADAVVLAMVQRVRWL